MSAAEVSSHEGSVFWSHQWSLGPAVSHTAKTHREGQSLPQRTSYLNRHDRGKTKGGIRNELTSSGLHHSVPKPEAAVGILISSPAICFFSCPTTFCCSNAYRVLMVLQIIIYYLVFLTSVSFTRKHTRHWTQPPQLPACEGFGGQSRNTTQGMGREESATLVKVFQQLDFTSCNTKSKTLCLQDLRADIGRTVFISR